MFLLLAWRFGAGLPTSLHVLTFLLLHIQCLPSLIRFPPRGGLNAPPTCGTDAAFPLPLLSDSHPESPWFSTHQN